LAFQSFGHERTRWRLFQKRALHIIFDIYIFFYSFHNKCCSNLFDINCCLFFKILKAVSYLQHSPRFLFRPTAFFFFFAKAVGCQRALHTENSGFASPTLGQHISTYRGYGDFIFYQKPLYKSLHQSFFYAFITILPSESGVTLHYSTILPYILLFRHLTSIFESTNMISRY
jgi:hypothetical protein